MSGSSGAQEAANLIGPQIGVSPSVIYGQFYAEDGASFNPPGTNNYGNLQPGGQEASYSSIGAFVSAFVSTIKDNFSGAENTGSDVNAYVNGLENGTNKYTTTTSAAQYAANITTGENMSGTSGGVTNAQVSSALSLNPLSGLGDALNVANSAAGAAGTATNQAATGALAKALGVNISAYDILVIGVGVILVIGAIFFISKPAVQSVTTNVTKGVRAAAAVAA
jgi:hypothetical protein